MYQRQKHDVRVEWENFTIPEIVDPNFRLYWSVRGQGGL